MSLAVSSETSPSPTPEMELLLIFAQAFVAAAPQRLAVDFVCELAEAVRQHQEGEVISLTLDAPVRARARRQAIDILRRKLPEYVRRLVPDDDT